MSETRFTPGPWEWHSEDEDSAWLTSGDVTVLDYKGCGSHHYEAENPADLSLIASAPDLYAALEAFILCEECGEDYGRCSKCDARAKAALARARGEEP
jgi:hypothetical protein